MPLIQSAIKRSRQNLVRRERRRPFNTAMKTLTKKFARLVRDGKKDEATAILAAVYKSIDMAAKKQIIHRNTASRRKSSMARMLAR